MIRLSPKNSLIAMSLALVFLLEANCELAYGQTPPIRTSLSRLAPDSQTMQSYERAVQRMKELSRTDPTDPRGWTYQANVHAVPPHEFQPGRNWNQCQHTFVPDQAIYFLAWHRGYLYYFERIIREMSDDPDFALPYWEWDQPAGRAIHIAFRQPTSSLFDGSRYINDGTPLAGRSIGLDLQRALQRPDFWSFQAALGGTPHGAPHVQTGDNMADPALAARDPIFWCHHCNVDRLWNSWLSGSSSRSNPTNQAWLATTFTYFDEHGAAVERSIGQILSDSQGVIYDSDILTSGGGLIGASPQEQDNVLIGSSRMQLTGTTQNFAVGIDVSPPSGIRPLIGAGNGATSQTVAIVFRGLDVGDSEPRVEYEVFVKSTPELPNDESTYAGTINFFGRGGQHQHMEEPGNSEAEDHASSAIDSRFDYILDVQPALEAQGVLDGPLNGALTIEIVPLPANPKERQAGTIIDVSIPFDRLDVQIMDVSGNESE